MKKVAINDTMQGYLVVHIPTNTLIFSTVFKGENYTTIDNITFSDYEKFASYLVWVRALKEGSATLNCDTPTLVGLYDDFKRLKHNKQIDKIIESMGVSIPKEAPAVKALTDSRNLVTKSVDILVFKVRNRIKQIQLPRLRFSFNR